MRQLLHASLRHSGIVAEDEVRIYGSDLAAKGRHDSVPY